MYPLNGTLPGEVPPPPDAEGSRCHLLGTTGIIVQFISKSCTLNEYSADDDGSLPDLSRSLNRKHDSIWALSGNPPCSTLTIQWEC